jgi:hypothetical protein
MGDARCRCGCTCQLNSVVLCMDNWVPPAANSVWHWHRHGQAIVSQTGWPLVRALSHHNRSCRGCKQPPVRLHVGSCVLLGVVCDDPLTPESLVMLLAPGAQLQGDQVNKKAGLFVGSLLDSTAWLQLQLRGAWKRLAETSQLSALMLSNVCNCLTLADDVEAAVKILPTA